MVSQVVIHHIKYWKELCGNPSNYYLVGLTQQIIDKCRDSNEDLQVLQDCVADYTKHELSPQQQDDKQEAKQPQQQQQDDKQEVKQPQQQQQQDDKQEVKQPQLHQEVRYA